MLGVEDPASYEAGESGAYPGFTAVPLHLNPRVAGASCMTLNCKRSSTMPASSTSIFGKWVWVFSFSIAFAWVESSVVIYLREIYFEGSFYFPIHTTWHDGRAVLDTLMRVEFGREIATIIMLISIGCAAGKKPIQKFCFFMVAFGIWDIFYYIWLRVLVGWPENLMTWDLLFFVPLPWVGPVITPLLIALAMVVAGSQILYYENKGITFQWRWYDWTVEFACGLAMIVAFCWDWRNILRLPGDTTRNGMPNAFAWWIYLPAYVAAVAYYVYRLKRVLARHAGKAQAKLAENADIFRL